MTREWIARMPSLSTTIVLLGSSIVALGACLDVNLEGRPCPCLDGFACVDDVCVPADAAGEGEGAVGEGEGALGEGEGALGEGEGALGEGEGVDVGEGEGVDVGEGEGVDGG